MLQKAQPQNRENSIVERSRAPDVIGADRDMVDHCKDTEIAALVGRAIFNAIGKEEERDHPGASPIMRASTGGWSSGRMNQMVPVVSTTTVDQFVGGMSDEEEDGGHGFFNASTRSRP